jgi:hypothetical protein
MDTFAPVDLSAKNGIIYYGTYRKWRQASFQKYLTKGVSLSASNKNWKKFKAINCDCEYLPKLEWTKNNEDLRKYKYSIYIEDEHTHNNYAFLANRFYEALMTDTVILFDSTCSNTIAMCGYPFSENIIITPEKLQMGLTNYVDTLNFEAELKHQRSFLDKAYEEKRATIEQIKKFLT